MHFLKKCFHEDEMNDSTFSAPVFKRQLLLHLCILAFLDVTWNNKGEKNKNMVGYLSSSYRVWFRTQKHLASACECLITAKSTNLLFTCIFQDLF